MKNLDEKFLRDFASFVRNIYGDGFIPLHRPQFTIHEVECLRECIESNFVSSVSDTVTAFETEIKKFTGAKYAISTVNGTSGLHVALIASGVCAGDEVLTQAFTFVATCNAIAFARAVPIFLDIDHNTLGLSALSLQNFLEKNVVVKSGQAFNRNSGKKIAACIPMHSFGNPCEIKSIVDLCDTYNIKVIEDAAESLGSYYEGTHTGLFGESGVFSFNGNKIITSGGGGMIVTNKEEIATTVRHLTTTAKVAHPYKYSHDTLGFNYRMPGINAALGLGQLKKLPEFLKVKQDIANLYRDFFESTDVQYFDLCSSSSKSNNWLNAIIFDSSMLQEQFLKLTNSLDIMTRPPWDLMIDLPMYSKCEHDGLDNSKALYERLVNIPSSVP